MATSVLSSSISTISNFPANDLNHVGLNTRFARFPSSKTCEEILENCRRTTRLSVVTRVKMSSQVDVPVKESTSVDDSDDLGIVNIHHVGLLCSNLERSLEFYQNLLGLKINEARPHDRLPYRGVWFWVGSEMIHLMELPNPDPLTGRPEHGGRDRHACIGIKDVSKLKSVFDKAVISSSVEVAKKKDDAGRVDCLNEAATPAPMIIGPVTDPVRTRGAGTPIVMQTSRAPPFKGLDPCQTWWNQMSIHLR